ncbi:L30e-like protein [Melanomma pulvis-pyrius CBS 109.77]|uniref:L30e-like protein n=1 Tax=Melanomma pulvis-pyrius CBS 109.77 TaxID=1314802 RepID=A0A6A6WX34_9PLEO|nr:L30e-like protein [Melanomma pulvis-pyrius CBS 109.77]
MGKDASEKKIKKDKKEKKEKRTEVEGVVKSKKEKKDRKSKTNDDLVESLESELKKAPEDSLVNIVDGDVVMGEDSEGGAAPLGALVPFALPLADDQKDVKKILRTVKKSAKTKTLRRGVKEVVKALRKSAITGPSSSGASNPSAITIIAADISPMDVISHIPVLCEDHNIPYIYVRSRAELGEASATKRPTSVVMVSRERVSKKAKDVKEEDVKDFEDAFGELVKLVGKASKGLKK